MFSRRVLLIASLASLSIATIFLLPMPALGASAKVVQIIGTEGLGDNVPGGQIYQFKQGRTVVRPGDSITWRNETMDPHTITLVSSYDAENPDRIIATVNPTFVEGGEHMPPFVPALDRFIPTGDSAMRLELPGDSIVVAVHGETAQAIGGGTIPDHVTAAIVAKAGSRLYYYCAFHVWMEGRIDVVAQGEGEKGL